MLDRTGRVRFNSRNATPEPADFSDRDYFRFHLAKNSQVLYVGQPQAARKTGAFFVGISRRLSDTDGSFAGVVAGTIQLNHFKQLFKELALGPGGAITLAHTDGTILMRWPFSKSLIGRNIKDAEILQLRTAARSGHIETTDITDGVRRVVAYSQVRDLPVLIGVGQATRDIFEQWRTYALTMALLVAALCGLSALLAIHLMRDIRQRDAMERKLVALATTDGLTGVSNRRHFNEAIAGEWRKAQQTGSTLALLMIDADQFKLYNDRHGHQAGDRLLKIIGSVISRRSAPEPISARASAATSSRCCCRAFRSRTPLRTWPTGFAISSGPSAAHTASATTAKLSMGAACLSLMPVATTRPC